MAARNRVLLLAVLLVATFAGCTANDNNDEAAKLPPPAPSAPPAGAPEATPPPPRAATPPPEDFEMSDAGEITGTFERTWDIQVANVAYRDATMRFSLDTLQPGAPPTARIHLTLYDPNGALIRTESVGLGAPSNAMEWSFSLGELPQAGSYALKAVSAQEAPLPSAGFASYEFVAWVHY